MSYLTGWDVSKYQGSGAGVALPDFSKLATPTFVILKASGGDAGLYEDPDFKSNQNNARLFANLGIGYYHYAGGTDPISEADYFLSTIGQLKQGEFLCIDFELANYANPGAWCGQFYNHIHDVTGIWCLVYSNRSIMANIYQSVPQAGLWLADPDDSPDSQAQYNGVAVPYKYVMQQFAVRAVNGFNAPVDTNAFFGTLEELCNYGYQTPTVTKTTLPEVTPPNAPTPAPSVAVSPTTPPTSTVQVQYPPTVSSTASTPSRNSNGTVIDIIKPKASQLPTPTKTSEVTVVENEVRSFVMSNYRKFITAIVGAAASFVSIHYGANHMVQLAILALTSLGVYVAPNSQE